MTKKERQIRLLTGNTWGLLGPETLSSSRRTRTLGLSASVRLFNDLAVPGLGGVWYGKQLLLALLGVAVAEQARSKGVHVQNIEVANAIEALACWLAFKSNGWNRDPRLRGNTKLQRKGPGFKFAQARQRNFYVTQPMRMATVQALPALGFVEADSARFNTFICSDAGITFIDQACKKSRPYNRSVMEHISLWVLNKDDRVESEALSSALSPLVPLTDDILPLLRERLIQGGNESPKEKQRRKNALSWVENIRVTTKPLNLRRGIRPMTITEDHWHDLMAGAKFFRAREAAIAVLDALELYIGNQTSGQSCSLHLTPPECLSHSFEELRKAARAFLDTNHINQDAITFCRECTSDDTSQILRFLVTRDSQVLRLVGDEVKPGPAFRGKKTETGEKSEEEDSPSERNIPLPEGISYRIHNLYLLNLDLCGELDQWLNPAAKGDTNESQ